MIVSIHQPQYLPWAAYLYKVMASDVFILFDTVQYVRGHANRNQIKGPQAVKWLTIPVQHSTTGTSYENTLLDNSVQWAPRHWATLNNSYQRGRGWVEIKDEMKDMYESQHWRSIADVDAAFLQFLIDKLNLKTKLVRASSVDVSSITHSGVAYLIALTKAVGGDKYISGRGAGSLRYVTESSFASEDLELVTYDFVSPTYSQLWGDFIPDLSIIDVIASRGLDDTKTILQESGTLISWPKEVE
jgi:hypothetical protein